MEKNLRDCVIGDPPGGPHTMSHLSQIELFFEFGVGGKGLKMLNL